MANSSNEKMTNSKALAYVLENCEITDEVREKLTNIKVSIDKKNGASKKPTKEQVANNDTKDAIYNGMEVGKAYTITMLIKSIEEISEMTNQKVSALVRQLVESGKVTRSEDKRVAYFTRA